MNKLENYIFYVWHKCPQNNFDTSFLEIEFEEYLLGVRGICKYCKEEFLRVMKKEN